MGKWLLTKEKPPKIVKHKITQRQLDRVIARQGVERSLDAEFGPQDFNVKGHKVPRYADRKRG